LERSDKEKVQKARDHLTARSSRGLLYFTEVRSGLFLFPAFFLAPDFFAAFFLPPPPLLRAGAGVLTGAGASPPIDSSAPQPLSPPMDSSSSS
jgi:hypothetical protein